MIGTTTAPDTSASRVSISVVIPTLDEAGTIVTTLRRMSGQGADEVVVADGGSRDGTAALARGEGARVVSAPRGRGVQQNRGAAATTGDVLLFLHADCWLDPGALTALRRFIAANPRVAGGCFRMRVAAPNPLFRLIDAAAQLRAGLLGIPYGDQGIFVPRGVFARVGGFPEVALMEDVLLACALRRRGRLAVLPPRIHVSPRRWQHQGILRQTLRNTCLILSAALGVPPRILTHFYPVVR
jgi:rSAM/selenodomain-associated transferase 2